MSTSIGQKQAVIDAVAEVLGSSFVSGTTVVRDVITSEQLTAVRDLVFNGIMDGSVSFTKDTSNEKDVRRYVSGMIDNHFRKAIELNGGSKYAASPANSRGSRDEQLSTLKKLLKTFPEGSEKYSHVAAAIAERQEFLNGQRASKRAAKKAAPSIDVSKLPAELQGLFSDSVTV